MVIGGAYYPRLRRMVARFAKSSQLWRPRRVGSRGCDRTMLAGCIAGAVTVCSRSGTLAIPLWSSVRGDGYSRLNHDLLRDWAVYLPNWRRDGCTGGSLPPTDLASAGHGDQEGGWGDDARRFIEHSRFPVGQHFTACPHPALPAQASLLSTGNNLKSSFAFSLSFGPSFWPAGVLGGFAARCLGRPAARCSFLSVFWIG